MDIDTYKDRWMKRARRLSHLLIISVTLNIGLVSTFVYSTTRDKGESQPVAHSSLTNELILRDYATLSFQELIPHLSEGLSADEGYTHRDLALSILVTLHHFDLEKALGGMVPPAQKIPFRPHFDRELVEIPLYPGLNDGHFIAINDFIRTEKCPLTPHGTFLALKSAPTTRALQVAFCYTPHYRALKALFPNTKRGHLILLTLDGPWELLENLPSTRRALLFSYLNHHSKTAAKLLVATDTPFIRAHLSADQQRFIQHLVGTPPKQQDETILHVVQEGESLWRIARRFNISIEKIMQDNNLQTDKIQPGKTLRIPN